MYFATAFQRQRPLVIFVEGLCLVLITGFFDILTGYEVSLSIIYSLPIYITAWSVSKQAGILMGLICGIVWWWASIMGGHPYPNSWLEGWETFVRIAFFVFIAIGAASLKREHDAAATRIALLEHSRRLEREIIEISEREQRRIGRDLHDGLCQYQAALACSAASLNDDLRRKNLGEEARRAGELATHLRDAVAQTRDLARGLVPVQMEEMGLASALEELARSVSQLLLVRCEFELRGEPRLFENNGATQLYRIAQEAINNATRHGRAENISISLTGDDTATTLRIRDDGIGINKSAPSTAGMGMSIMQYRANVAGGELIVEEASEGGTDVSCIIPFQPESPHAHAA
ncbi:MAG: ATP-binding protein [Verrucomicrobiota bacterium]|nr:ATP-binding protein [Verrucomicrobiota bacterium]